jgi:anti-sigma B factor antagonist
MQTRLNIVIKDPDPEKQLQTVVVDGEIDRDTVSEFREKLEEVLKNLNQPYLMLDFTNLEFINSEGIGFLTDLFNRLEMQNKKIMILNASARIMDIFQLVGLNQIIPCCNSEEECLKTVS